MPYHLRAHLNSSVTIWALGKASDCSKLQFPGREDYVRIFFFFIKSHMQQNLDTCWSELVENAIITSFLPSQLIIQISAWILTIQSHIAANGGSVELQM